MQLTAAGRGGSGWQGDLALVRQLLAYVLPYKWQVAVVLLLSSAVALEAVPAYLFHLAIDTALNPVLQRRLALADGMARLDALALVYAATLLAIAAVIYLQVRLMQSVAQRAMADLRHDIFVHLQALPITFYDRTPSGRLITRATADVGALSQLLSSDAVAMLNDAVLLVVFAATMLGINWRLGLVTLAMVPVSAWVTGRFRVLIRTADRAVRAALTDLNAFLQEHISGMTIVQVFNREEKARQLFARPNRAYRDASIEAVTLSALFAGTIESLVYVAVGGLFWYGGGLVLTGSVQVGMLVAFMLYAQRFFRPIQDLSQKFDGMQAAMASVEGIMQLLAEPVMTARAFPADPHAVAAPRKGLRGAIEFRDVWFRYRDADAAGDDDWVLRGVSFKITPGEMVAFVGRTGAGKTTVIQLLLRFYAVERGQILLDGIDIRAFDPVELRRHFGVVLQDATLCTGTIESNVRFNRDHVEDAGALLRQVGLGPLLDGLPDGDRSTVSERGGTLSAGQRQLICFARALACRPDILIFDEATSNVDSVTEQLVRDALDRSRAGRTAILVAHRLSAVRRTTRILVFHEGRICEEGTNDELLRLRGRYWRLHALQSASEEHPTAYAAS